MQLNEFIPSFVLLVAVFCGWKSHNPGVLRHAEPHGVRGQPNFYIKAVTGFEREVGKDNFE
jgi:hypothetical protein